MKIDIAIGACVQSDLRLNYFFKSFMANLAAGMRANEENSSTMRPISATCLLIVSVKDINKSCSTVINDKYFRFKRSAES